MKRIVLLALLALAMPASADVYRCVGADGATTFSQTPCSPSAEKVAVSSNRPSTESADCAFAENFARTASRLMRQGVEKDRLFEQYGGPGAFDAGSTRMVDYVYQYQDTHNISQDRIAELTVAQCNAGTFGGVTCQSLPEAYTNSGGGCGASFSVQRAHYDVDTFAIHREQAEERRQAQAEKSKQQADEMRKHYEQQKRVAACRKDLEHKLARLEVQMVNSSDPRRYRSQREKLQKKLAKCGRYVRPPEPEVKPQPGGYHRLRRQQQ